MKTTEQVPVILVVDDEPMVCRTIARCLDDFGTRLVNKPREALELLMRKDFDLVLCDIMMPDLNGVDLYEQAVEKRPCLKERFIFISGGALGTSLRERVKALSRPLLPKPFELIEFRQTIAQHLDALHF